MALTAKKIDALRKKPGRYIDGGDLGRGLYLQVTPNGASWLMRYERSGRERWMGLGALRDFSLSEARARARAQRQLLADGIDPLDLRKSERVKQALERAKAISFEAAAKQYSDVNQGKWESRKYSAQFLSSLKDHAFSIIGNLPVSAIDTGLVIKVLERHVEAERGHPAGRFWDVVHVTADRVRTRIEAVLDFAAVRGYRPAGDNPARWKGHIANVLPARTKQQRDNHHPALPYSEAAEFVALLHAREGVAALALEFTILTCARTGETLRAVWDEIDLHAKMWIIPANRMKGGKEHRVPLCNRALEILEAVPRESGNPFVFVGPRDGALGAVAMNKLLKRMGRSGITVHGFRSTFRDWGAEQTTYPSEMLEMALAHTVGNKVEAAYRRSDMVEKRRRLMADWARYCATPAGVRDNVMPLRGVS